jgi:type VII secretion integral membrane protein EccD
VSTTITSEDLGTGFCRVAIAAPTTRVDLALPVGVPVVSLLPAIVTRAEQDPTASHGWTLRRLDGARLDPAAPLALAGVREGELLLLTAGHDEVGDPLYDDVVEVLGEGVADAGWTPDDTRVAAAGFGVLAVLGALFAALATGGVPAGILTGVLALLLLGGGAALSHAAGDLRAGIVLGTLAAVAGPTAGVILLGPPFGAAHLLLAAGVVVLVAAAAPPAIGGGDAVFLGLGVAGLFSVLGALLALVVPTTPARAAAIVASLALAATTVMPTLALRLSRIPRPPLPRTAVDLEDVPGQLDLDLVRHRVARARALLSGLVLGCYAVLALGVLVLTDDIRTPWPSVLAAVLGVLVLLRARLFRRRAQVAAPLVTAGIALLAGAVSAASTWAGDTAVLLGAVAPVALVVAALAAGLGLAAHRAGRIPKLARAFDTLETVLLVALIPLILAVWEVYTALLELRA